MNVGLLGKFIYVTLLYVHMLYIECDLCSMDVMLKLCRWFMDSGMLALQNINSDFCCGMAVRRPTTKMPQCC